MTMQTLHLTDKDVLEGLEKAVVEKGPDYRYRNELAICRNFIDGKAACIAGHVYAQHAVTLPYALHSFPIKDDDLHTWEFFPVASLVENGLLTFESMAGMQALATAQCVQDDGKTWGTAFEQAKGTFNRERSVGSPTADEVLAK